MTKKRDRLAYNQAWAERNREHLVALKHSAYMAKRESLQANQRRYGKTPRCRFFSYRRGAAKRDMAFTLTFDEFMLFWQKPCFYCSSEIATIGLDRVDNTQGYVIGNVAPCCKTCNFGKRTLSQRDFIAWCVRIARKHGDL